MKKIKDGKHILLMPGEQTKSGRSSCFYIDNEKETEIQEEDFGGGGFIKTYYERKEKEFSGIV